MPQTIIDEEKCQGCGECVEICPSGVLELQEKDGKKVAVVVNQEECLACRACEAQCPNNAITVIED